jgi:hypothetical protein
MHTYILKHLVQRKFKGSILLVTMAHTKGYTMANRNSGQVVAIQSFDSHHHIAMRRTNRMQNQNFKFDRMWSETLKKTRCKMQEKKHGCGTFRYRFTPFLWLWPRGCYPGPPSTKSQRLGSRINMHPFFAWIAPGSQESLLRSDAPRHPWIGEKRPGLFARRLSFLIAKNCFLCTYIENKICSLLFHP